MNRNKELIKNTFILGFGQLAPKIMAIITLPILTAYLTKIEYGTYDLSLSLISFLIPIITLQIQQAVLRYLFSVTETKDRTTYVTNSVFFIAVTSLIGIPVILLILTIFKMDNFNKITICSWLFLETVYILFGQILRGLGLTIKYSFSAVLYAVTNLFFVVLFVLIFKWGFSGLIFSLLLSYILSILYMIITAKIYKFIKPQAISKNVIAQLISFSIPIVPSSISLWIVNLSDRIVITQFLGMSDNGIYSVANKIPNLYNTANNIFNLSWTETAAKVNDDGESTTYYGKLFHTLYNFLVGLMLVLIALTPFIFNILINEQFESAYYQIPILYFGVFFSSFVSFYSGIYLALKRTKQVAYSSILGAIINLAINLCLIKYIGLYAASISTAISFLVIALYRAIDLKKFIKMDYNLKNILIGFAAFIVSAILCYQRNVLSILLCTALAVIYNLTANKIIIHTIINYMKKIIGAKK